MPAGTLTTVMCSKNKFGLRLTKDAFNAALNGSSLEDANRMEDRNQALIIANAITEAPKNWGDMRHATQPLAATCRSL
jgi:hypothetical protein